jgi:hypothetical protein
MQYRSKLGSCVGFRVGGGYLSAVDDDCELSSLCRYLIAQEMGYEYTKTRAWHKLHIRALSIGKVSSIVWW